MFTVVVTTSFVNHSTFTKNVNMEIFVNLRDFLNSFLTLSVSTKFTR